LAAIALLENALPINSFDLVNVELKLSQIRRVRTHMLAALLQNADLVQLDGLHGLVRYERTAFARQKQILSSAFP
jgi:hypothetical protein